MMREYVLYHMPGSCSRVAINALEETGVAYAEQGVALLRGAQYEPWFLAINPKAKVPTLVVDGVTVTELPAILYLLAGSHAATGLMPVDDDGRPLIAGLSDMIWMSSVLHPLVARLFRPQAGSESDAASVKAAVLQQIGDHATAISARIAVGGWWYGDRWSIADTFLAWLFALAGGYGFVLSDYPVLEDLRQRIEMRPAFVRASERERAAVIRDAMPVLPGAPI